jgi:hypothetical protein
MYIGIHGEYPLFLAVFNESLAFGTDFKKILKYQFSQKSVQLELSFTHRHMTQLIIALRNVGNAPENESEYCTLERSYKLENFAFFP